MIHIYRSSHGGETYDCEINEFHKRDWVRPDEVVIREKNVLGRKYIYAEPRKAGFWACGGSFLYTSNGIYPEFSRDAIPLHDRNMELE